MSQVLRFIPFMSTGVQILEQPSEIFERLDNDEVALQNMMGNRFVGFFEARVTDWKAKLRKVRSVLTVWLEVQRSWCQLEPIFTSYEDLRKYLPDEAKRFGTIDTDFKEQMADANKMSGPFEACLKDGRYDALCRWYAGLELCQKNFGLFLEAKKMDFPRAPHGLDLGTSE